MADLVKLARSQPCYFRLPEFCYHGATPSMLCHFRVGGTGGTALKPPDVCGAPGCKGCHDVIDGRTKQSAYTPEQLRAESHRAQNQWLEWLWKNEYLIAVTP